MLICDTHADTLYAHAVHEEKEPDYQYDVTAEMLAKNAEDIRVQTFALYVSTGGMQESPTIAERELAVFERLKQYGFRQIRHISEAQAGKANILLSIEGCEIFGGSIANVEVYAKKGVRLAALMWNNENGIAHPAVSGSREGLTAYGKQLVQALRNHQIAVDISHLNERGSDEVMDSDVPPLASHSCAHALCDHPRNLTDAQLRRMILCGGFVGVNFYANFLNRNGQASLDTVADHMAHICELGGEDIIGFGSDFDGIDAYPEGLRRADDIPSLLNTLRRRGFDEKLVKKVAGENFRRYLERIDASRPKAEKA